ncbi:hypothetical protein NS226_21120 [Aureimonas ureilytica]|uniref:Uncharacterized protein n=1 Tax=Aureimonas ureilytica TaxID=401562 RepID=A0A175R2F9_9HYPH|nr:hypothetical protein [Aureimonas ureilytica]KTQ85094.1 hypothetical protein NS226_21120 [Aureimonas ureilytica]
MSRHYDIAANEAQMRHEEVLALADALARSDDANDRAFSLMQNRLRDTAILPVLEAMRSQNDGLPVDMAPAALASTVMSALWNMAPIIGRTFPETLALFMAHVEEVEASFAEQDGPPGVPAILSPIGNA